MLKHAPRIFKTLKRNLQPNFKLLGRIVNMTQENIICARGYMPHEMNIKPINIQYSNINLTHKFNPRRVSLRHGNRFKYAIRNTKGLQCNLEHLIFYLVQRRYWLIYCRRSQVHLLRKITNNCKLIQVGVPAGNLIP